MNNKYIEIFNDCMKTKLSPILKHWYGDLYFEKISNEAKYIYTMLYNDLPDLGDEENQFWETLYEAAVYLSVYKCLNRGGVRLKEICDIIYAGYIKSIESTDNYKEIYQVMGEQIFTKENIEEIKSASQKSKDNKFKKDYIVDFVSPEPGDDFDFGTNTYQCPIEILFREQGASEILQCICDIDFVRSKYLLSGLERKKCLAHGDTYCEFRWHKGQLPSKIISIRDDY
jgi:hypothetical protein